MARASERRHGDGALDLSLLTDGLRAEREEGITIDVAHRYFSTSRRRFVLADTPGHGRYTRNMVTGASNAHLALVLVDARHGVVAQSRRHAFIASLLRVPHMLVAVNKMDLVGYSEAAFDAVVSQLTAYQARLDIADATFVPVSALHGDNVVHRSRRMSWYEGPTLLHHLEHVHVDADRNLVDARFPVQYVIRTPGDDVRRYAGQIVSGVLRPGDEVVVLPGDARTRIETISTVDGARDEAFAPMSVTVTLADPLDVARGDQICRARNRPLVARDVDALVCWMGDDPAVPGRTYALKQTTRTTRAVLTQLLHRIDVETLRRDEEAPALELNEIGRVTLRTQVPLAFDPYARNRATGAFILIDESTNDTVGAGMLLRAAVAEPRTGAAAPAGAVIRLFGREAAAVAALLETRLRQTGVPALHVCAKRLEAGLNAGLGPSGPERAEAERRLAHVAQLVAAAGGVALVTAPVPGATEIDTGRGTAAAEATTRSLLAQRRVS